MSISDGPHREIIQGLKEWGVKIVAYVPDRWIGRLCMDAEADPELTAVNTCREEEGVALCVGALATGTKAVMVMQNAGFLSSGTGINFAKMYRVPLLMLISYRGNTDETLHYHVLKGNSTEPVLDGLQIQYRIPDNTRSLTEQVVDAGHYAEAANHPFALLLKKEHLIG